MPASSASRVSAAAAAMRAASCFLAAARCSVRKSKGGQLRVGQQEIRNGGAVPGLQGSEHSNEQPTTRAAMLMADAWAAC